MSPSAVCTTGGGGTPGAPLFAGSILAVLERAQLPRGTRDLGSDFLNCNTGSRCSTRSTAFAVASRKAVKYKQLSPEQEKKKSP